MRVFLVIAAALVIAATQASPLHAAPATRPKNPSDALVDEAVAAVRGDMLLLFAGRVERELARAMGDLKKPDQAAIVRLARLREFGRYFARLKDLKESDRQTMAWLIQQPNLSAALMMQVSEFDPPDHVLEILRGLREAHKEQVEANAELSAALCVVWDSPERTGRDEDARTDVRRPVRLFAYFSKARLKWDLRNLPAEMLAFVVDADLTDEEIQWAEARYANVASPGIAYFDMPYDEGTAYESKSTDGEKARVLPNMLRRGGNAADAAYFASQVGKALGVPSVAVRGRVVEGWTPAWVAFLKGAAHGGVWDDESGRRDEHDGWPGEAMDPQTYETIGDGDLAMVAGLVGTKPLDRLASMALVKSADALRDEQQLGAVVKAIELSPANRRAWETLARMAGGGKLSESQNKQIEDVYRRQLARRVPEYALAFRLRTVKESPADKKHAALKKIAEEFKSRPELYATARIADGDLYASDKRTPEALAAYGDALVRTQHMGPIVVQVMGRIDPMLHKSNELERLAEIYAKVHPMTDRIRPSAYARTTPYYIIGDRYAGLLEEMKEESRAQGLRAGLESVLMGGEGPGSGGRGY